MANGVFRSLSGVSYCLIGGRMTNDDSPVSRYAVCVGDERQETT